MPLNSSTMTPPQRFFVSDRIHQSMRVADEESTAGEQLPSMRSQRTTMDHDSVAIAPDPSRLPRPAHRRERERADRKTAQLRPSARRATLKRMIAVGQGGRRHKLEAR